ncbi:DUF6916 family protein [Desulfosporosinus lacus]|uniref:DUF6916 domain-containing protein n=1 Tax=Desulfosporosinus lacus DSM 15449 TaxID=1121420 RepID=A0A1M5REV1_9FIRM|nr:hypothetical protein [Desulfosporosinus lacus]SHH24616.1 hypothetical protein SAMN02746098_00537 [Desulfosporosinus lacus DSM 15449]
MLNNSLSAFQTVTGSKFEVILASGNVPLVLSKIIDHGSTSAHEQFSLILLGPGTQFLPQQIYSLRHESLGELELFLVPVGRESAGSYQYEIVFNCFIDK